MKSSLKKLYYKWTDPWVQNGVPNCGNETLIWVLQGGGKISKKLKKLSFLHVVQNDFVRPPNGGYEF